MTTIPLDTKEEDDVLQGVSGVLVKYILQFRKTPCWRVKDLTYQIGGYVEKKIIRFKCCYIVDVWKVV